MFETLDLAFHFLVRCGIFLLEVIGAAVILYFSGKSVFFLFRRQHRRSRAAMTEGITSGLNLLLGAEVLRTIVAPDWSDIGMTCAILAMRAGVTFLLTWEHKHEVTVDSEAPAP